MFRKTLIGLIAIVGLLVLPVSGQEYGVNYARNAYHITTNTTNTPVSQTARLATLVIQVSNAGTSWVLQVKTKEGTPKILYNWVTATGVGNFNVALDVGVLMTSGIDIVTSGTTPGVADVFIAYR